MLHPSRGAAVAEGSALVSITWPPGCVTHTWLKGTAVGVGGHTPREKGWRLQ